MDVDKFQQAASCRISNHREYHGACNPDCCASSDPAAYLSGAPTINTDQQGCATVSSIVAACTSNTLDLSSLPATQQARCICYPSQVYRPDILDEAADRCYNYLSSQIPASAAVFSTAVVDFCKINTPTSATAVTTTASITTTQVLSTCGNVVSVTSACTPASASTSASVSRGSMTKQSPVAVLYLLMLILPFLFNYAGGL